MMRMIMPLLYLMGIIVAVAIGHIGTAIIMVAVLMTFLWLASNTD